MAELSKFYKAENVEIERSMIHFADYNPRLISEENKKTLKKGIKKFGLVGGIVVNKRTGYTLVQGHQRLSVMDELMKYNSETNKNDYKVRCDLIDMDEKSEKELVVLLNNPNAQGEWDYNLLRDVVMDIDYSAAGLTDADLAMMGIESITGAEVAALGSIGDIMMPQDFISPSPEQSSLDIDSGGDGELDKELERADYTESQEYKDKVQHMKDVKAKVKEQAIQKADESFSYVMLSFDNMSNMMEFFEMFGLSPDTKIIKGEELMTMLDMEQ